jgi:hypothetical protein
MTMMVRDNSANVVKACKVWGVSHFGCVGHTLHLIVGPLFVHKNYDLAVITNDADADADAEEDILDEDCLDDIIDYGEDELLDAMEEFECQYKRKVKVLSKVPVVANFRKITKYIQKLTNESEKLNGIQYTNGSSIAISLDVDVCTRWNSTCNTQNHWKGKGIFENSSNHARRKLGLD